MSQSNIDFYRASPGYIAMKWLHLQQLVQCINNQVYVIKQFFTKLLLFSVVCKTFRRKTRNSNFDLHPRQLIKRIVLWIIKLDLHVFITVNLMNIIHVQECSLLLQVKSTKKKLLCWFLRFSNHVYSDSRAAILSTMWLALLSFGFDPSVITTSCYHFTDIFMGVGSQLLAQAPAVKLPCANDMRQTFDPVLSKVFWATTSCKRPHRLDISDILTFHTGAVLEQLNYEDKWELLTWTLVRWMQMNIWISCI